MKYGIEPADASAVVSYTARQYTDALAHAARLPGSGHRFRLHGQAVPREKFIRACEMARADAADFSGGGL